MARPPGIEPGTPASELRTGSSAAWTLAKLILRPSASRATGRVLGSLGSRTSTSWSRRGDRSTRVHPARCSAGEAFLAATLFGVGTAYFWPTMLSVTSELFPRGGAFLLALMGGAGNLAIAFVLPVIGVWYDTQGAATAFRYVIAARDPDNHLRGAVVLL